jgi:hypothetical protein
MRVNLLQTIAMPVWKPEELFPASPSLYLDSQSWALVMVLATLGLAVILTEVGRAAELDWSAWAGGLALAGLGMLAVLAGNPLTLLLAWTLLDLVELLIMLRAISQSAVRERVVLAFSVRVGGSLLVVLAALVAQAWRVVLGFEAIPVQAGIFLVLGAGLRLGVLPLQVPLLEEAGLRRGLGTLLRLVPVTATLILLARLGVVGLEPQLESYVLAVAGFSALYGGAAWLRAGNELEGRPFWILGMAALALGAAVRGQQAASMAWGLALVWGGSTLFLASTRRVWMAPLGALGLLGLTGLPYTPTWAGGGLYASRFNPLLGLFLLGQILLVLGFARHALRLTPPLADAERWVRFIYPLGLALLVGTAWVMGGMGKAGSGQTPWLPGVITLTGILVGVAAHRLGWMGVRAPRWVEGFLVRLLAFFSFNWLYRVLWGLYHTLRKVAGFLSAVLEGEGGILWALLLLVLLVSIFTQIGGGG